MALHEGATFINETVLLDGNEYRDCIFNNCQIRFNATAPVTLNGVQFNSCQWTFEGPAGLTVNFMTSLYQAGMTDLIDQTIANIRRGSYVQQQQQEAAPQG